MLLMPTVWVARYKVTDSHSLVSQRWIDTMLRTRKQFAAPEILYLEVVSALARTADVTLANRAYVQMSQLQRLQYISVDNKLITLAVEIAIDTGCRGADCLYVAVTERLNVPLVPWDDDIHDRAGSRIRVIRPA
jgi:predicted nucleic acid-binding protein